MYSCKCNIEWDIEINKYILYCHKLYLIYNFMYMKYKNRFKFILIRFLISKNFVKMFFFNKKLGCFIYFECFKLIFFSSFI